MIPDNVLELAADWWVNQLCSTDQSYTGGSVAGAIIRANVLSSWKPVENTILQNFRQALITAMKTEVVQGRCYLRLHVDYEPSGLLARAWEGYKDQIEFLRFPVKTLMEVEAESITVSDYTGKKKIY